MGFSRRVFAKPLIVGLAAVAVAAVALPALADEPRTEDCAVDEILVNSCRPWLGARASDYPDAGGSLTEQHEYHEKRIGRPLDIAHTFAAVGQVPLSKDDEVAMAQRKDTWLFQNWKPTDKWAKAGGGDAEVDSHIDAAAESIKKIAPKQIFLTIHHEAENDVSSDPDCEVNSDGSAGTAAEYVQMWHNVQDRFAAKGVDNVVWVIDYMNYAKWDCLVPKLYPGDDAIDWIMFNAYGRGATPDFAANVDRFYSYLTELSGDGQNLLAKPWGIVEWGIRESTQEQAGSYYAQAAKTLDEERFPNLKAYMIFDSPGTHDETGLRVGYDDKGKLDPAEQQAYTDFANHPAFSATTP